MTLIEIAESLRAMYPEAVAVQFFVNHDEYSVEETYKTPVKGQAWKRMNGTYVREENNE